MAVASARGAAAPGLADGQVVRREPYLAVYNMIDPRTGERLPGRAPGSYAKFAEILKRKLDAEPHATHERYLQLEREAAQETRRSPVYTDITIAHNKSVSVLHASFREQARSAGQLSRRAMAHRFRVPRRAAAAVPVRVSSGRGEVIPRGQQQPGDGTGDQRRGGGRGSDKCRRSRAHRPGSTPSTRAP